MQRIGIVGAGGMGSVHAGAYAGIPGAQLVAVADIDPQVGTKLAEKYGVRVFSSLEEMLAGADLDVVDICTPTIFHSEMITKSAEAGKHVVTEKPLARDLKQCREAIRACKDAKVTLFVAQVLRYFPEFVRMREIIKSGAIGNPATVRTTRGGTFPRPPSDWYANYEWSGGLTLDLIIHDFDWILWTFGPAQRVFAKGLFYSGLDHIDYSLVTIRLASGAIAHVEGTWAHPTGFRVKVEVAGDSGLLNYDSGKTAPLVIARKAAEGIGPGVQVPESPLAESPYYLELKHFIDCLETGAEPAIKPEEAMQACALAFAALESMKTGRPVDISEGVA